MANSDPLIRNISDTASLTAAFRGLESARPDALFRDPFAQRLAGARGEQILASMPARNRHEWAWITRTWLFDQFISEQVRQGVDLVVNLAAGLDARPYRMALPAALKWVEVDLPAVIAYKQDVLGSETPVCGLERVALDLADVEGRRVLFQRLGGGAKKGLIVSEGILIYLTADEVGALARDLAAPVTFQRWIFDIASPGLLRMMQKEIGRPLRDAGAPLKFAPPEGPDFFRRYGWQPVDVRSMLKTAASLKRLSPFMRLLAMLPDSKGRQGSRPWSAVGLLARQ
jgi:methyltransferase (TIGR00027 family)